MKKILLVLIVLKSTVPLFSQAVFKITGGAAITSSNGSYIVINNMNLVNDGTIQQGKTDGTVKFTGNTNHTISGSGITNLARLHLAFDAGTVLTLQSNAGVDSEFVFSGGLLNLDNYKLDLGGSGFLTNESELSRAYSTGTGYIETVRDLSTPLLINAGNLGAVISSASNLGSTVIRRGHQVQNNVYGSNNSILRYYDISPANNTNLNATLRFRYLQEELNGINEDTLGLWRSNDNISWTQAGYTTRDVINNYVEKTGIGSFSRGTLAQVVNTTGFRNISISNNPSANEGDNGTKELKFIARLNASSTSVVQVQYTTIDSTATAGSDYVSNNGTLTFAPGQLTDTIRILINGDEEVEPDEYFQVQLTNAVNAIITTGRARATIRNDDSYPSIIITNYTLPEGNTSDTTLLVKVRLNKSYPLPVSMNYATQDSTATAGSDYTVSSGILLFTPGDTLETIPVTIKADLINEPSEIIKINLSNPVNSIAPATPGRITITNDDALPQVIFANVSVAEGNNDQYNNHDFTVRLNRSYPLPVTVNYQSQDSTATNGSDYQAVSGTLTFVPGDTLETFSIPILGDRIMEPNEIIKIILSNATNATVNATPSRITITNDDALPQVIFVNTSVPEGNNDQYNNLSFTVRLNRSYPLPVTVNYQSMDSTAINGSDYQPVNGMLTFVPGDTLETFTIPIIGDRIVEPNEIIKLLLGPATNATLTPTPYRITITNDDSYPVININAVTVAEGDVGNVNALFTVRTNKRYPQNVSVQFTTQDVTATAGADYLSASGTIIFPADGDTLQTILVPVGGDLLDEANETFKVQLSAAVNGTIAGSESGTGTITDNDPVPAIRIYDTTATEASGNAVLRVNLNNPSGREVRISYRTQEGTALDTLDYVRVVLDTLVFQPGETEKTINLSVLSDVLTEGNETFPVILQSPVNGTTAAGQGGDNTAIVTIINSPAELPVVRTQVMTADNPGTMTKTISLLQVRVLPNPSQHYFLVNIIGNKNEVTHLSVTDMVGRIVEQKQIEAAVQQIQVGTGWSAGTYILQVRQGKEHKVIKLVKTQ